MLGYFDPAGWVKCFYSTWWVVSLKLAVLNSSPHASDWVVLTQYFLESGEYSIVYDITYI